MNAGDSRAVVLPFAVFAVGAVLLLVATRAVIPRLVDDAGIQPHLAWFLSGGFGVFIPLVATTGLILRRESGSLQHVNWSARLRFRSMSSRDWVITATALLVVATATSLLSVLLIAFAGPSALHPPFLPAGPLDTADRWVLAAWVPFWALNILGEEFAWRGVLFPIQQDHHGSRAWLVHGLYWALFHLAFGWAMLLLLLPILFGLPYAVQRTGNTWVGVILHGALNGPAFVALSLGVIAA